MTEIAAIQARLRETSSVPELLALSLSAFESIRVLARGGEDAAPGLFAAFLMTADAAVDGREAITIAPSLSLADVSTRSADLSASDRGIEAITDALAALGALLDERLTDAAGRAPTPDDRAACRAATGAARRIHQLMARDDDDRRLR
jgi:hypothetical protein